MSNPNLKAGPGRPKGMANKVTVQAKEALQMAFDGIGGVKALTKWANDEKNKGAFFHLYTKLLPIQITGDGGGPVKIEITPTQATIA